MIKLIVSDMDGTFLNPKGTYDKERFQKLLDKMTEKGISFVVASGNRMDRLNAIFSGISGNIDFVAENGALVIDHGEVIARESMSEEQVNAVLDFFDGKFQDYRIVLSGIDSAYVMTGTDFDMEAFDFELEDVQQFFKNMVQVDDFHKRPADPIVKITMTVSEKSAKKVTKRFNRAFKGELRAVASGYGAVDIIKTGIHKAWGVQTLMSKHGIKPEEVAAFGDGGNDREMLELAGHSYAVANASDEIKKVASYIIQSNARDGVLNAIENILERGI
ncbi:Cof-type HAD-IIB family hydrolase [Streptococcus sp.]|uniref:Cof-type HAD-IIB family hydrolase n=1 Tax=Streptococcus sp. TaxID=1306 RepID=UPI0026DAD224|nr:Cof-type HAD-IIB family hydrolase [Streptococcus sp.]MDO4886062.1 Cof-type HAD-IIB family hydrolase [Streptococcus sp.]